MPFECQQLDAGGGLVPSEDVPTGSTVAEQPVVQAEAPDGDLVARYLRGDHAAFETLYRRWVAVATAFVVRILGAHHVVADEVVSAGFLGCALRLELYDPSRPFFPFLSRFLKRRALDRLKRLKRAKRRNVRVLSPDHPVDGDRADPVRLLEREELRRQLDSLPVRLRTVLELLFWEDRSLQDIAGVMDVTPQTIAAWKRTALERLGKRLA